MDRKVFNCGLLVMLTLSLLCFISCGSEESEEELQFIPSVESSSYFAKGMVVPAEGMEVIISFSTNKSWRASVSEAWCKLLPNEGKAGENTIVITMERNNQLAYRKCTITISSGGQDNIIAVTQAGSESLLVEVPQAGMLAVLLRDQIDNINSLVVKGELNGTDFKLIRRRASNLHLEPFGLDLTDARIVEGGDPYDSEGKLYTKNDVVTEKLFYDCENLQKLKLPSIITKIERMAFHFVELQTLDIPSATKWIDDDAFYECKVLELHMRSVSPPSFNPSSFYTSSFFSSTKCTLYVPIGSKKAYEDAYGSNTFKAIIEEFISDDGDGNSSDDADKETVFTPSSETTKYIASGIDLMADGGVFDVSFYTNKSWTINLTDDWCTLSANKGESGNNSITIHVSPNELFADRECVALLTTGGQNSYISIRQKGKNDARFTNFQAGSLPQLIGENYMRIESLSIDGEVNGTDVELIRRMENLRTLNLEKAKIVKGGSSYTTRPGEDATFGKCYTEENTIGKGMFFCLNLETLILPQNAIRLEEYAIYNCINLTSCVLPNALKYIEQMGFSVCGSLKEVNIPEGVLYIGNMNFYSMYSISTITFPYSLQLMGHSILKDCRNLSEVHIKAVIPPNAENEYVLPFENMTVPLYVPRGCKEIYQASKVWSVFSDIYEE